MKISPLELFNVLYGKFGNQNWWPIDKKYHEQNNTDPRFEIIIGAILTQNTAWINVEKALNNLKKEKIIDIKKLSKVDIRKLQEIIKPSGFFNQKAKRVKNIALYFHNNYNDNLDNFFSRELSILREELLSLNGIGPETADSILLYAGSKPIFVIDAYTKRICKRIPLYTDSNYDKIQQYFEKNLENKFQKNELVKIYNEFHALILEFVKTYCKKKPECNNCPFQKKCSYNNLSS